MGTEDLDARELARLCSGLASDVRVRLVIALSGCPEGMIVGDLLTEIGIPASTLSHHLDRLRSDGWVVIQRQGTFLRYSLRREAIVKIAQFIGRLKPPKAKRTTRSELRRRVESSPGRDPAGEFQIEFD